MARSPDATVVVCTLQREQELQDCLNSLDAQTHKNFETVLITAKGPLAALRNDGWRKACAPVVCYLDDDAVASPTWMSGVLEALRRPAVLGVSGPSSIPLQYRGQRHLLKFRKLHNLFLDQLSRETPGMFSSAGAISLQAAEENCSYEGPVQYLEACNMSFKKEAIKAVNGFDEAYGGIGDWSEPDLCLRIQQLTNPRCFWFSQRVKVEHHPSRSGMYSLRRQEALQRWNNYDSFSSKWLRRTFRHRLYRATLRTYYFLSGIGWLR